MTGSLSERRPAYLALVDTMTAAVNHLTPASGGASDQVSALRAQLTRARGRLDDPNLYLAVIGDFSSGKSTLINALLGYDLLKRAEQKTTSTALRLRYGDAKTLTLKLTTGETLMYPAQAGRIWRRLRQLDPTLPGRSWWRDLFFRERSFVDIVQTIGARDALRPAIALCEVTWPSDFLRENVTIIDTPGLNAMEVHQAITEGVLRDTADLAIITMRAQFQLSMSTETFLAASLGPFLPKCLFVVTIADEERELDLVMTSLRRRLSQAGAHHDQLLQTAALRALERAMGRPLDATQLQWANAFVNARATILSYLQANAERVIQSRIRQLLAAIDDTLHSGLEERERALAEQGERLREAALPALDAFVAEARRRFEQRLDAAAMTMRNEALTPALETARTRAQSALHAPVYAASNEREIDAVARSDVSPAIQEQFRWVQQRIQQDTTLQAAAQQGSQEFSSAFDAAFQKLHTLAGAMRVVVQPIPNTSMSAATTATIYQETLDNIWRTYSGQKDGALKKWARRAFKRDQQLAEYRAHLVAEYDALTVDIFSGVQLSVVSAQDELVNQWKREIARLTQSYLAHYQQAYDQVRLHHERDLQAVREERQRVSETIARVRGQFQQTLSDDGIDDGFYRRSGT